MGEWHKKAGYETAMRIVVEDVFAKSPSAALCFIFSCSDVHNCKKKKTALACFLLEDIFNFPDYPEFIFGVFFSIFYQFIPLLVITRPVKIEIHTSLKEK